MNILIGVPVIEYRDKFVKTFMNFWSELLTTPKPYTTGYTFIYRNQLDVAQNRLAETAVQGNYTHLMLIEDDVYGYSKVHLDKLLMNNLDVVSGAYYMSEFPYDLCALRLFDRNLRVNDVDNMVGKQLYELPEPKGIQEVDLSHVGFTLIKTDVFKRCSEKWFDTTPNYNSDAYFCNMCREHDVKVHVDCDVVLDHRGITPKNVVQYKNIGMIDEKYKEMKPDYVRIAKDEEEAKKWDEETKEKIKQAEKNRL